MLGSKGVPQKHGFYRNSSDEMKAGCPRYKGWSEYQNTGCLIISIFHESQKKNILNQFFKNFVNQKMFIVLGNVELEIGPIIRLEFQETVNTCKKFS